jgi:CubicO group peptidase (beta-lactamase class C family)
MICTEQSARSADIAIGSAINRRIKSAAPDIPHIIFRLRSRHRISPCYSCLFANLAEALQFATNEQLVSGRPIDQAATEELKSDYRMRRVTMVARSSIILIVCACVSLLLLNSVAVVADEKTDQVDLLFATWDSTRTPGIALAVVRDGRIIYKRGYGMANLEQGIPIFPDTVFYVGSVSKQFTAFCIAMLAHEGRISLEASIRDYLPELPECFAPVQVQHLIYHTSGIRDFYELMILAGVRTDSDYYDHADIMELLKRQRTLNFPPGEQELYSNSGYFLLAELTARVSGKTVNEFARERIFGPLGMADTIFHQDHAMLVPRRADGYAPDRAGGFKRYMGHMNIVGAGGVFSTVEDLYLWDEALYGGQFDSELIEMMHRRGKLNSGEEIDYAFGLSTAKYRGLDVVMHGGALFGFRAGYVRFPAQRLSVICLGNLSTLSPEELALSVAEIYLGELMEGGPRAAPGDPNEGIVFIELPEAEMARLTGTYRDDANNALMTIFMREGGLVYDEKGWRAFRLAPVAPDRFRALDSPFSFDLRFETGEDGIPAKAVLTLRGDKTYKYAFLNENPPDLSAAVGRYYCDELDAEHRLELADGELFLRFRGATEEPLVHRTGDEFFVPSMGTTVTLLRGDDGEITSFRIDTGRARNLIFVRR